MLSFATTIILAGAAFAQVPPGSSTQPNGPSGPNSPTMQRDPTMTPGTIPDQQATPPMANDKRFLKEAAQGSMTEVELGKLAQEKGSSDAVKEFGKRMVDDHTKATEDLKQAASKANVNVPSELPKKAKKTHEKLSKLSGAEFDRAYAKLMLKDHKDDIKDFQTEAKLGTIPEVKEFAANTLPTLQEHLKLAEQMEASTRGGTSGGEK
ncbi:MAG TPA: DUF4142 domain-containing protein [Bryobacteraceae bacterium]|nr:DUF4142 domain-containing protein [Bryobacteraceae bacterium]